MTANTFRRLADRCRAIPASFGLREHTVSLVRSVWSDGEPGVGTEVKTETPLTVAGGASPKVRFPSQKEIALGYMSLGEITIGPFTPDYQAGGVDRELFSGAGLNQGEALLLLVRGPQHPDGAYYRSKNVNVDRALRVTLTCIPAGQ